ncbi:MAG: glutaredoxin family protein, partial [Chitinophagaceae bacterium]
CHLCEHAKAILWPLLSHYHFRLKEVDIAADDKMIEKYGTRIPVLGAENNSTELNWPFTTQQVEAYFTELANV